MSKDLSMKQAFFLIVGAFAIATVFTTVFIFTALAFGDSGTEQETPEVGRIVITAAHISPTYFPDYTLLYTDDETDTAVYLNNTYEPEQLDIGSYVTVTDTLNGKVIETTDSSFYIECNDPLQISYGLSGHPVTYSGREVGFVSSLEPGQKLKCVYY
jgi:hypothetical protein